MLVYYFSYLKTDPSFLFGSFIKCLKIVRILGRDSWMMSLKEGTCCIELWVLQATDASLNSTPDLKLTVQCMVTKLN